MTLIVRSSSSRCQGPALFQEANGPVGNHVFLVSIRGLNHEDHLAGLMVAVEADLLDAMLPQPLLPLDLRATPIRSMMFISFMLGLLHTFGSHTHQQTQAPAFPPDVDDVEGGVLVEHL